MSEVMGYLWLLLLTLLQYLRGYGLFVLVEVKGYLWLSLLTLLQYIRGYELTVACNCYLFQHFYRISEVMGYL